MSVADYEVDYSDLVGRKVECPDGCGLCCLCQPEVLPEERQFFRKNYPENLVLSSTTEPYHALALKKGRGSCVFLKDGCRKCQIYDHRTAYCRQFPYHIYVSDRVKVELDLSCRGVWTGKGNDAVAEAKEIVFNADRRIVKALREATPVYREFYDNCREAGVMSDSSVLRMSVSQNLEGFSDLAYLSKVMEMSELEPVMSISDVVREIRPDMEALEEAARLTSMESMASDDPLSVPVYCDKDWNWNVFMAKGDIVEWMVLGDEGEFHHKDFIDPVKVPLKPLTEDGRKVLSDYISTLNGRDSFMGSVYSLMDWNNYEDDMANAYYGCLSTAILDLMWRASLLDHFFGTGMGAEGIREAIIFYDMDRLDAPAIGAFV